MTLLRVYQEEGSSAPRDDSLEPFKFGNMISYSDIFFIFSLESHLERADEEANGMSRCSEMLCLSDLSGTRR